MDNLVDIDALLGNLELEADDFQHSTQPVRSTSQRSESTVVVPTINGATHAMTNGSQSMQSEIKTSNTRSYMDDLMDISADADFGPSVSSLQIGANEKLAYPSSQLQPTQSQSLGYLSNSGTNYGLSNTENLPSKPPELPSQTTASLPAAEKNPGSRGLDFDIFNLPNPDQFSMSSTLQPLNFPSLPKADLEQQSSNGSNISSHQLMPPVKLTSSHSQSLTGSQSSEPASLPDQRVNMSHSDNKSTNSDYGLPLTEDIDFLNKYEHQSSTAATHSTLTDGQHLRSSPALSSAPNQFVDSLAAASDAPIQAQAPSLSQFSSEFSLSSNTDTPNFTQSMPPTDYGHMQPAEAVPSGNASFDLDSFANLGAVDTASNSAQPHRQNFDENSGVDTNFHHLRQVSGGSSFPQQIANSSDTSAFIPSLNEPEPASEIAFGVSNGHSDHTSSSNQTHDQQNYSTTANGQHMVNDVLHDPRISSLVHQSGVLNPSHNNLVSNSSTTFLSVLHRSQPEIHSNHPEQLMTSITSHDSELPPGQVSGSFSVMSDSVSSAASIPSNHSATPMHSFESSHVGHVQTNSGASVNSLPAPLVEAAPTVVPDIPLNQQLGDYGNVFSASAAASVEHSSAYSEQNHQLINKQDVLPTSENLQLLNGAHNSLLNSNTNFQVVPQSDSNIDDAFNSLLAANGYPMPNGTTPSAPSANVNDSFTSHDTTANNLSSPLIAFGSMQKDPNMSGSIDSFTKLQYTESQQAAESFTALHNMSISQAHRNSLLEENGILPTSEVEEDMGWDIGATTTSVVGADDVFADIGLDEPMTGEVAYNVNSTDFGPIDELPPGTVPTKNNTSVPGFVEESSAYFTDHSADMYVARDDLVSEDIEDEPTATTADLQAMVTQEEEEPAEPDVADAASPADAGAFPDIPPPPYQVTDPALDPQSNAAAPENSAQEEQVPEQSDFPTDSGEYLDMGATKPLWLPDSDTDVCMACEVKFSFTRRRHHCRSCGKIFCDGCSNMRSRLQYLDFKEARVCRTCHENMALAAEQQARLFSSQLASPPPPAVAAATDQPSPHNAAVEVTAAAGAAPAPGQSGSGEGRPVPAGVLKDTTANRAAASREASRSVIFSDGIRPGDENSHLDGSDVNSSRVRRKSKNRQKTNQRLRETLRNTFLIPETTLPPLLCFDNDSSQYSAVDSEPDEMGLIAKLREESDDGRFAFAIHKDLRVEIKIINMDCCTGKQCWCFTSHGLNTVSQDEVVFVLECLPDENSIPRDVFHLYKMLYQQAAAGQQVTELGYADLSLVSPFDSSTGFFGSTEHTGLLFIRSTFQCVKGLCLPSPPYLFAVLIHRLELPWARLFPVRLKLRLGAEFKYYPCPLMSVRGRAPVYREIGNTIMNLLADFHTYKYSLNKIEGFTVHLMDKVTTISIPKNMYPSVMKVVGASQECVIAFGASFSSLADSHIVCMQNEDGSYTSRTMNIRDQQRTVTGASFVVFSGSMKESYGVSAKCSIVEDGIMVQITKEALDEFKAKLNNMQEYTVICSRTEDSREPNEQVKIVWVDDYKDYNIGVVSPVDDFPMDGVMSLRVKSFNDLTRDSYTIRWTEVFFVQVDESRLTMDAMEITQFSETIANSTCSALAPFLGQLHTHGMKKVALRVTLGPEQVEYICGSQGCKLKADVMNSLDGELVPVLHSAASVITGSLLVLELIFHILE